MLLIQHGGKMKLTIRQLRLLIEEATQLSKDAMEKEIVDTISKKPEDGGEGGASGLEPIKTALEKLADKESAEIPEPIGHK